MEFRWVGAIALWTVLSGPVLVSVTVGARPSARVADHVYETPAPPRSAAPSAHDWQPAPYKWPETPAGVPPVSLE
jgi:hypothetical protein